MLQKDMEEESPHLGREAMRILLLYSLRYFLKSSVRSSKAGPVERDTHCTRHFL